MRRPVTVAYNEPKNINTVVPCDQMIVHNGTPHTLFIRIGSDSAPSSGAASDLFVPPYSNQTFPVETMLFGFLLTDPSLPDAIPGLPDQCLVVLSAGERDAAFSAMPVATSYLATDDILIVDQGARNAGTYTDGPIAVPAYVRTLIVRAIGVRTSQLVVTAGPTQRTTFVATPTTTQEQVETNGGEFFIPWYRSTDSEITISYTATANADNGYQIRGSRNAYPGEWRQIRGQQRVDVMPLGLSALPVSGSGGSFTTRPPARSVTELAASAVRAATGTFGPVAADGARGVRFYLNVTAVPGAVTITPNLRALNNLRANTYDIATAPAAIGTTGMKILEYYPGADAAIAGNVVARQAIRIPTDCYVVVTHSGAGNFTYSIDYELLD